MVLSEREGGLSAGRIGWIDGWMDGWVVIQHCEGVVFLMDNVAYISMY